MAGIVVTSPDIGTPSLASASSLAIVPGVFLISNLTSKSSSRHQYFLNPSL